MEFLLAAGVILVVLLLNLGGIALVVRTSLIVVPPDRLLVLSGRSHQTPDGEVRGYRMVKGGRAFRIPFLERASWLPLEPARFEEAVELEDAGPVTVSGSVRVRIDEQLGEAVTRYVDKPLEARLHDAREPILAAVRLASAGARTDADLVVVAEAAREQADEVLAPFGLYVEQLHVTRR